MDADTRLVHLTTVVGSFHAKVVAARLATEGIATAFRGYSDGPYPLPTEVHIYVAADDLAIAAEILLADDVETAFLHREQPASNRRRRGLFLRRRAAR